MKMLWLKRFFQDLSLKEEGYVVYSDGQSAIDFAKNSTYHSRMNHADIRYHWIWEVVEKKMMRIEKIHIDKYPSNMMTNVFSKE